MFAVSINCMEKVLWWKWKICQETTPKASGHMCSLIISLALENIPTWRILFIVFCPKWITKNLRFIRIQSLKNQAHTSNYQVHSFSFVTIEIYNSTVYLQCIVHIHTTKITAAIFFEFEIIIHPLEYNTWGLPIWAI